MFRAGEKTAGRLSAVRDVVYRIDDRDRISFVNPEYDAFALANNGHDVFSGAVLGRPLWEFVADPTTRSIYGEAIGFVRGGRSLLFSFRCDSPARRRLMRMGMCRSNDGGVQFCVRTVATEDRPAARLFVPEAARSADLLIACGWCKKIYVGDDWQEIEQAVASLRLFGAVRIPFLSHGICEACRVFMAELLNGS